MAKRVPAGEVPYRPLDKVLVNSVMAGPPAVQARDTSGAGGGSLAVASPAPAPAMPQVSVREPQVSREEPTVVTFPRPTPPEAPPARRPEPRPAPVSEAMLERRDREKRVLLTEAEERDIERLVHRLAGAFRTPVKLSHFLRGCLTAMLNAESELFEKAKLTTLTRPGNGNAPELAQFEHVIAQVLVNAFREARPLR